MERHMFGLIDSLCQQVACQQLELASVKMKSALWNLREITVL